MHALCCNYKNFYAFRKFALSNAKIRSDCRDLLGKLLERDPERRITAPEAMQHPWMMGPCHDIGYRPTTVSQFGFFM